MNNLKITFYITFVFLTTTATITFIEALRTPIPMVRHIMNLETAISIIAAFFYNKFITSLNKSFDLKEITLLRYIDWSLTTPFMLLSLCLFLGYNSKVPIHIYVILPIWILNYIMLYIGYLGEIGSLSLLVSCVSGFIPLLLILFIIYKTFLKGKSLANNILFTLFTVIWSLYGIVYILPEMEKNIITNILDLISKCIIGIGMWMYYAKIIK